MDATFVRSDDDDGEPPTLTVTFSPPIAAPAGEIPGFTLREPTARQLREAEKEKDPSAPLAGQSAYEMRLIVLVASDPALTKKGASDRLPIGVINQCIVFLNEFIEAPMDEEEEAADLAGDEPVACTLPINITFGKQTYTDLDIREPLGSEVRNARMLMREPGNLFESRRALMHLVTTVSGLPAPVIEALPIRTLNKAGRILGRFTMAGRATGKR